MTELAIYKRNRINELITNFNNVVARLNSILANNIKNINRMNIKNNQKQQLINSLINNYNSNISILKNLP